MKEADLTILFNDGVSHNRIIIELFSNISHYVQSREQTNKQEREIYEKKIPVLVNTIWAVITFYC